MALTQSTFERVVLEDPEGHWELYRGHLGEKPSTSYFHNELMSEIGFQLRSQLATERYVVRINSGRLALEDDTYSIPDIFVAARTGAEGVANRGQAIGVYSAPVLLVVEIWSSSTG